MKAEQLAEQYRFKIRDMGNGLIYITSKHDEWYLDILPRYVEIYHKNTRNVTKRYHSHKLVSTLEDAFKSIHNHDVFTDRYKNRPSKKKKRMDYLFNLIKKQKGG